MRCARRSTPSAPTSSRRARPSRRCIASRSSLMIDPHPDPLPRERAKRWMAVVLAAALSGCAALAPPHPETFSFAVLGDAPYNEREEVEFSAMIGRINREALAFVLHVGDFKGGGACSDELYAKRKAQ